VSDLRKSLEISLDIDMFNDSDINDLKQSLMKLSYRAKVMFYIRSLFKRK
jgi:hypothetical protein